MPGQSAFIQGMALSDARLALSGVLATNSTDPGDIRLGVLYTGQGTVIGATAGLSVTVLPLHFVGSKGYSNGAYLGFNPTTATVTVPAAPTVGLKRIDILYVVQQDPNALVSADPSGVNACVFGVKTGVASSSPLKPALTDAPAAPVGAQEVGTITWDSTTSVPTATNASASGASCTIATTCQWTATRGAPIPVRNSTERGSLSGYGGQTCYDLTQGIILVSDYTGAWRSTGPFAFADGKLAVTTTTAAPNQATVIPLPTGLFTLPPVVEVTWESTAGFPPGIRIYSVAAASFGIDVLSGAADQGPVTGTVHWTARQATATAA